MGVTKKLFCTMLVCSILNSVVQCFTKFRVCCPTDYILYKNKVGLDSEEANATHKRIINGFQSIERPEVPLGYGIEESTADMCHARIENCTHFKFDSFSLSIKENTPTIYMDKESCLAVVNSLLVSISCQTSKNDAMERIDIVNKCCPHSYIYSTKSEKCIRKEPDFDIYSGIFSNAAIFDENAFKCSHKKVLVEYTVTADTVMFSESHLIWNDGSKSISTNGFCIEAITDLPINEATRNKRNHQFLVRACQELKVCKSLPCIRKCCAEGEVYMKGNATTYCKKAESDDIEFYSFSSLEISGNFSKPSEYGILHGLECPKFRLDPDLFSDDSHSISSVNGSLVIRSTNKIYTNNHYCIENIYNSSFLDRKLYTFLCFDSNIVGNDQIRFKLYPIGLLISCCFYALTLIVYISIKRLRNLPGKILISLVSSLLLAYLGIALGQLMPTSNDNVCFISGFFVYFCLIAAFSWMNVTCFDIWKTFGSTKSNRLQKREQASRFIWYSVYGWGLPTFLTAITAALTKSDVLPENVRPLFGNGRCWFTYDTIGFASLIFFSGPVGFLFLINLGLFLVTLKYCNKVKKEIYRMQSSNNEKPVMKNRFFMDKTRFVMNTKLCFVMGITWLLELTSIIFYDHKKTFFWSISDSFNVLLGVFVFFIFVFKKRIWQEVMQKLGIRKGTQRRHNTSATRTTQITNSELIASVINSNRVETQNLVTNF